jgi:hypothetical protein
MSNILTDGSCESCEQINQSVIKMQSIVILMVTASLSVWYRSLGYIFGNVFGYGKEQRKKIMYSQIAYTVKFYLIQRKPLFYGVIYSTMYQKSPIVNI